jgi:hypothetical protein
MPGIEDQYPVGSQVTTTIHSIGGRSEKVTGVVVGHWRGRSVTVETAAHGTVVVEPAKIEALED